MPQAFAQGKENIADDLIFPGDKLDNLGAPQQSVTPAQQGIEVGSEELVSDWCERGDSNPHGFPRQILSLVRLPIPPLSRLVITYSIRGSSCNF